MKRKTLLAILAALAPLTATAQTSVPVPILNPYFQDDTLQCSAGPDCFYLNISGWVVGPQTGVFKTSKEEYPTAPASGLYVAYIGGSAATGSIQQTLGVTVQANTTYTLSLSVGARADFPFTGYLASLVAGNVTLASSNRATPVGGTFVEDFIVYKSGATPVQLGQPLQINVQSLGAGQVNIATVTLTMQ